MGSASLPVAWRILAEHANGRPVFGEPGIRDPAAPCDAFEPVPGIDWLGLRVTAPGTGYCGSDGHYLCLGCAHLSERGVGESTTPASAPGEG